MTSFLVTLSAIIRYLAKAREAKEQLDQANAEMKAAAQQLCSVWKGDAAEAFAAEQEVLYNWCAQLSSVGGEYISAVESASRKYEEAEQAATNAMPG